MSRLVKLGAWRIQEMKIIPETEVKKERLLIRTEDKLYLAPIRSITEAHDGVLDLHVTELRLVTVRG